MKSKTYTDLADEFKRYLQEERKGPRTVATYMGHVGRYHKWCMESFGFEPAGLFHSNLVDFKSYLIIHKHNSPATINLYMSSLMAYNDFLVAKKYQDTIVIQRKDRESVQEPLVNPNDLETEEVEAFRQRVLEGNGIRDHCIVTMLAYSAVRISELCDMELANVDLVGEEMRVRGKGGKTRIVYLHHKVVAALRDYLKVRNSDSPFLFPSRQKPKLTRGRVNQIFNKYSDRITPHKLRHYCLSLLYNVGEYTLLETAAIAGHSDTRTTKRYTHPERKEMKRKLNSI